MTAPDRFSAIPDVYPVAAAVGVLLDAWFPEYLSAIERQTTGLAVGDLERPAAARVRHAGIWRRGEQTPAIVTWPEGVVDHDYDPEGAMYGTVQLGVLLVAAAVDEDSTTRLVQRYTAAARAILLHRPVTLTSGAQHSLEIVDEDYTPIDPEDRGRVRAGVRLDYLARDVYLGRRDGGPPLDAEPRPDPEPPWPPDELIETAGRVVLEPVAAVDPL